MRLVPNAQLILSNNDLSQLDWKSDPDLRPSDEEIEESLVQLQVEHDAQEYARNRKSEYPTIAELTVALYDTDDKAALATKRAAVKTKWPKDNSGPVE